ncbi:Lactobacillus shifted protein [Trichophyton interdigitale]|uniref:Lactobacillus shifted protein n=1 Tax=Trichophyton interdigitale TaxID=101480 RepID=A0A9P4YI37_9EURO|nr:Lactobacillus shifted protein [Trichophyton interdigitale]KAF3898976.1 Lactobacillus shifted protein [Trichophyton interdigitale]KAG8211006.1 Lactobacillus shifted protein [Trichophyton interdigitale]
MLSSTRSRLCLFAAQSSRYVQRATYTSTVPRLSENTIPTNNPNPPKPVTSISETNAREPASMQETVEQAQKQLSMQAPNRATTWAKSQQERSKAMAGPRFEQTIIDFQPQPYAAIDLIHKQPVRWTKERVVSCDGGGGPLGHPRIFINTDKPQICPCEYCGLPFANEHHRAVLEAQPRTSYPLEATRDAAEINETQRITPSGFEQR